MSVRKVVSSYGLSNREISWPPQRLVVCAHQLRPATRIVAGLWLLGTLLCFGMSFRNCWGPYASSSLPILNLRWQETFARIWLSCPVIIGTASFWHRWDFLQPAWHQDSQSKPDISRLPRDVMLKSRTDRFFGWCLRKICSRWVSRKENCKVSRGRIWLVCRATELGSAVWSHTNRTPVWVQPAYFFSTLQSARESFGSCWSQISLSLTFSRWRGCFDKCWYQSCWLCRDQGGSSSKSRSTHT